MGRRRPLTSAKCLVEGTIDMLEQQAWQNLMIAMGFAANQETYQQLLAAYSETHRHYHNQSHIQACLQQLTECSQLIHHPHWVELALWFHDAIYKTRKSDNEQQSAQWAQHFIQQAGGDSTLAQSVYGAIMATKHHTQSKDALSRWVVDIDLSILGQNEENYMLFESNIRKEYFWVPKIIYQYKRKAILNAFLQRVRIYSNDYYHDKLDQQARHNMNKALANLRYI